MTEIPLRRRNPTKPQVHQSRFGDLAFPTSSALNMCFVIDMSNTTKQMCVFYRQLYYKLNKLNKATNIIDKSVILHVVSLLHIFTSENNLVSN
jgi:hypothetical protein